MVIAVMTTMIQNILTNFLLLVEIWAKPWIVDDSSFSRNMLNSTMVNVEWMNSSARVPKQICIKICLYCSVLFCTLLTPTFFHENIVTPICHNFLLFVNGVNNNHLGCLSIFSTNARTKPTKPCKQYRRFRFTPINVLKLYWPQDYLLSK